MLDYEAPVHEDVAKLFYRYFLGRNGWSEIPPVATSAASLEFRKNGCVLAVSLSKVGDSRTAIQLNHSGNYDLR